MIRTHKLMSYEQIIDNLVRIAENGSKYADVSYQPENPVYAKNFWRLYKKEAKNETQQSDFNACFPKARVWKNKRNLDKSEWRFYFNEEGSIIGDRYNKILAERHFGPAEVQDLNIEIEGIGSVTLKESDFEDEGTFIDNEGKTVKVQKYKGFMKDIQL